MIFYIPLKPRHTFEIKSKSRSKSKGYTWVTKHDCIRKPRNKIGYKTQRNKSRHITNIPSATYIESLTDNSIIAYSPIHLSSKENLSLLLSP